MATKTPPVYRKLTGRQRGLGQLSQLWLGSDHLLHVMSNGYSETYHRFYLRDIQAMLIVHTGRRSYFALTLIALLAITLAIVSAAGGGVVAFLVTGVIFLPLFIWNHWLGPGCRVVVVTAVQQESISSLNRRPKTRRVFTELRERIVAAQAELAAPPDEAGNSAAVVSAPPLLSTTPPPLPPPLPSV